MYLVVVIIQDTKRIPELLQAWQRIGVPGGTILRSAGFFRMTTWLSKIGLGALTHLFDHEEEAQRTILAAVEDEALLENMTAEADRILGGFERPNSGLLFVLPIVSASGLRKLQPRTTPDLLPEPVRADWKLHRDALISQVPAFLILEPIIVEEDTPLDQVAKEMVAHPNVHLACVVNERRRLTGVLNLGTLADDLFIHIMPEEFLSQITDLDRVIDFAKKIGMRNASDAMLAPVWVRPD